MSLFRKRRQPAAPPLLTVLMTTYDHEQFVEQALQSVVEQKTDFPFRLIVIEDCSNDRTRSVVERFAAEHEGIVRLALNETNENSNRRFASEWAACGSRYVALLDGDDYWTAQEKLQRQVGLLESRPECSVCFHDALIVREGEPAEIGERRFVGSAEEVTREGLWWRCLVPGCSPVLRRTLSPELPEWWTSGKDAGGHPHADWALFLLYAQLGEIAYIDDPMGVYRIHGGGMWSSRPHEEQRQNIVDILDSLADVFSDDEPLVSASLEHHRTELERGRLRALRHAALVAASDPERTAAVEQILDRHVPRGGTVVFLDGVGPAAPGRASVSLTAPPDDAWQIFGRGPAGTRAVPWIAPGFAYEFRLLAEGEPDAVLAVTTVIAADEHTEAGSEVARSCEGPALIASPNPAALNGTHGETVISWATGDGSQADVVVASYALDERLPTGGTAALAQLDRAVRGGAEYLFLPPTLRWWLDRYPALADQIERLPRVHDEPEIGVLYRLRGSCGGGVAPAPMYTESADLYDALYGFKDYDQEIKTLRDVIRTRRPDARTLLDVGCGTGKHLAELRRDFAVRGVDLAPRMAQIARERCPDVPIHEADMTTLALPDRFDVVTCLFSTIGYVRTVEKMRSAIAAMAGHLSPGGLLIVEAWFSPETYWAGRVTVNRAEDGDREIIWMYTSEIADDLSVFDINFLVGERGGVRHFVERHELGLFTEDEYLTAFRDAGLEVKLERETVFRRGLYVGQAPTASE